MNYRFDKRSKAKFKKDIAKAAKIEEDILERWIKQTDEKGYTALAAGRDGQFLDDKDVDLTADFKLASGQLIEVKYINPLLKQRFHLKVEQLPAYIKQDCTILVVNGYETKEPVYTLISPALIQTIIDTCPIINWTKIMGNKKCYRIPLNMFIWRPLDG